MRYSGKLGLAEQTEVSPGVWEETITERDAIGEMVQRTETLESGDNVLPRYVTTTSVSVLALGVGPQDNSRIRYVTHTGKRWQIRSIVDEPPRIVIYFGEEYHGPKPVGSSDDSEGT